MSAKIIAGVVVGVVGFAFVAGTLVRRAILKKAGRKISKEEVAVSTPTEDVTPAPTEKDVPTQIYPVVEDFKAMMSKFNVPFNDNSLVVGATGYLDKPINGDLFHGVDKYGRVYINLPITVVLSESRFLTRNQDRVTAGMKPRENLQRTAFVVFQRYNDTDMFVLGGDPTPMSADNPLGENHKDLSLVEKLLSGETVRFHDWQYKDGGCFSDPDNWIDVAVDICRGTV